MKPKTRSPDVRALIRQIPAEARDIPEVVIANLRPLARVVAIWRQDDGRPGRWVYLERMYAQEFSVDEVIQRYGGGDYRGKIFGKWGPERGGETDFTPGGVSLDPRHSPPPPAGGERRPAED